MTSSATDPRQAVLVVRGLCVGRGGRDVIRGLDLIVAPGEICALMGTSGAGKSTALRAIAALQAFSAGSIAVDGVFLAPGAVPPQSRLAALRRKVGMVFQSQSLFEHLSALDNVMLAPIHALGWSRSRAEEIAQRLLADLGVAARAAAYPRELSGGEAQRVAIARALALDPPVLLMDEPTSALDPARRFALGGTLRALATEGRALLVATHDADFARACADRVAILAEGAVVEAGKTADVLERPAHPATRELLRAGDEGAAKSRLD